MKTDKLIAKIKKLQVELQDIIDSNPDLDLVTTNETVSESKGDSVEGK